MYICVSCSYSYKFKDLFKVAMCFDPDMKTIHCGLCNNCKNKPMKDWDVVPQIEYILMPTYNEFPT